MKDLEKVISVSIETTGRIGSACLCRGSLIMEETQLSGKMKHSSELMPAIENMLAKHNILPSDVGYFFFPSGPGSFTGLRIAVTMAKMLAYALPVKLAAVNSLDVIAQNATEYADQTSQSVRKIASILDAKKNLFYTSIYQHTPEGWQIVEGDLLLSAEEILSRHAGSASEKLHVLGEGLYYYRDLFRHEGAEVLPESFWPAHARNVFRLGWKKAMAGDFTDPDTLTPLYIRRPEAVEKWESRSVKE